jgi:hypothetical protein
LLCGDGSYSARAADTLKREGHAVKILLGGIETLDNLVDLEYKDPYNV